MELENKPKGISSMDLLALKRKAFLYVPFCPFVPHEKQRLFLSINDQECLFGGAGFGGKTIALLMAALQYIDIPGYSALILRRTFSDMNMPSSILSVARNWFQDKPGVTWNERDHRFTFKIPGGGESYITFGYCETDADRNRYKSAEFQYIAFDELTTFSEVIYTFLFSRLRKLKTMPSVPLRVRGATNPGDIGHEWVKKRFVSNPQYPTPASSQVKIYGKGYQRPFIPCYGKDNEYGDYESYLESLENMPESSRLQMRDGLWVTDSGQRVYKHSDLNLVTCLPQQWTHGWRRAFVADLGTSQVERTQAFALVAWHDASENVYVEQCWKESGIIPSTLADIFREKLEEYGSDLICVIDEGGLGGGYANEMRIRYDIPVIAAEKKDKRTFRKLLNGSLEQQKTLVVEPNCKDLLEEWENLIYASNGLDEHKGLPNHCSDAVLYGWRYSKQFTEAWSDDQEPVYGTPAYWARYSKTIENEEKRQIREQYEQDNAFNVLF